METVRTDQGCARRWMLAAAGVLLALVLLFVPGLSARAEGASITPASATQTVAMGQTVAMEIGYSGITGGLGVISSDESVAVAAIYVSEDGTATLYIAGTGMGNAAIAVYDLANPAVVGYVNVLSGYAAVGEAYTIVSGTNLVTVFEDRVAEYPALMTGKNSAQLAVSSLVIERETGIDKLVVTGELWQGDQSIPGLNTFYANFYDAAGELIKRQAYYTRDPSNGSTVTLEWYLPDGCTKIVLE